MAKRPTTGCGASRDPELKKAVRRMKPMLARQADSLKRPLSLSGVALDWAVDSGVAYLHGLGADEIIRWVHDGAPLLKPHVARPLRRLPAS